MCKVRPDYVETGVPLYYEVVPPRWSPDLADAVTAVRLGSRYLLVILCRVTVLFEL